MVQTGKNNGLYGGLSQHTHSSFPGPLNIQAAKGRAHHQPLALKYSRRKSVVYDITSNKFALRPGSETLLC